MTIYLHRRGALQSPHDTIGVEVMAPVQHTSGWITYRGAAAALVAAGCATETMVAKRKRGVPKPLDERGQRFIIDRYSTKNHPERISIRREICETDVALEMPGVRDLFPEGFLFTGSSPTPAITASQWKADEEDGLNQHLRAIAATFEVSKRAWRTEGGNFQLSPYDLQRLEAVIGKFSIDMLSTFAVARVVDTRRERLRLVVNNLPPGAQLERLNSRTGVNHA